MTPDVLRRPLSVLAALALAALVGSTVVGKGGFVDILRLQRERAALGDEAFRLLRANEVLRGRIVAVRRSERSLERLARQELGLVRDGEIVYRFRSNGEARALRAD